MLKRTLRVLLFSTVCLLSRLTLPNAAQAATPDYTCYIQIGLTRVVDLTRSVCKFHPEKVAEAAAANAVYLSSVKKLVGSDERILSLIDNNPELIIAAAQNYCAARELGISEQQYVELQYKELMSTLSESSMVNGDSQQVRQYETTFMATPIAVELAPNYYCPGVTRR